MKIKICGITTVEDAQLAAQLGADFIGLIFAEQSPRYVEIEKAKKIVQSLQPIQAVGVFIESNVKKIVDIAKYVGLSAVQVYANIDWHLSDIEYWQAIRVKDAQSLQPIIDNKNRRFVLDAYQEKAYGGTGKSFDWTWLPIDLSNIFLAGGINADNVMAAQQLNPYGIDICSGVESTPGIKDHEKMRQLFKVLRGE